MEEFLDEFNIVYPSLDIAKENARLLADLDARWTPVGFPDLWIGSIVISEQDTLYTRNSAHFEKIPGLKLVDGSQALL